MATEFGRIPPAFLPIGTDYIFELIAQDYGSRCERIYLSVPHDFIVDETTHRVLARHGIEMVRVDPGDSIAGAISDALEQALTGLGIKASTTAEFLLIHGDSYVPSGQVDPTARDFYVTAEPTIFHDWGVVGHTEDGSVAIRSSQPPVQHDQVIAGLFGFSDPLLLLEILRDRARGHWLAAISEYMTRKDSVQIIVGKWFDFSFSASYYASRRSVNATREFNNIETSGHFLVKSSSQKFKMRCESDWFSSLPNNLRVYTPLVNGFTESDIQAGYRIEYLSLPSLANILLFGRLDGFAWRNMFYSLDLMLKDFRAGSEQAIVEALDRQRLHLGFFQRKTAERVARFGEQLEFRLDTPVEINGISYIAVNDLMAMVLEAISAPEEDDIGIVHGDLCASNILYDFAAQRVKVIDPRGYFEDGSSTIYGDRRYEVAKLSHSFIGLYDFIVGGRYELNQIDADIPRFHFEIYEPQEMSGIRSTFEEQSYGGYSPVANGQWEMMVSLFLSMLPLHSDSRSRQFALLCNAYRLMDRQRPEIIRL